jgi:hypothetical protein
MTGYRTIHRGWLVRSWHSLREYDTHCTYAYYVERQQVHVCRNRVELEEREITVKHAAQAHSLAPAAK